MLTIVPGSRWATKPTNPATCPLVSAAWLSPPLAAGEQPKN